MATSWGQYPKVKHQAIKNLQWRDQDVDFNNPTSFLPHGQGRSYGDSCLNEDGTLITTKTLNHLISFDADKGILRCEAGMTLAEILDFIVPRGWFLPVVPGTKFVSIGGAIANDVHGKNHHKAGTFGRYVKQFELLRSDGNRMLCSPQENKEYFTATIGGLGLTGLITWAEIQLKPITNAFIDVETIQFNNLEEFFQLSSESTADYEYTVAWIDCQATGEQFGRGLFMRGNHNTNKHCNKATKAKKSLLQIPISFPKFALNSFTMKLFNKLYFNKQRKKSVLSTQHFQPFFFPLDSIGNWNKIYGNRGFFQYQFVVQDDANHTAINTILEKITQSQQGSFLSVLKTFGDIASPGKMSFPQPGVTLALDFPNNDHATFKLLDELDTLVMQFGGRVYPAKDARMKSEAFKYYYPQWETFSKYIDPKFSSSFWRRVTNANPTTT